jgi:DNA-binding protein Fis
VQWNRSEASRILGIHRNSLKMKLKRWGVDVSDDDAESTSA